MFNDFLSSDTDNVLEEMSGEWMRRQLEAASAPPNDSANDEKPADTPATADSTPAQAGLQSLSIGAAGAERLEVVIESSESSPQDDSSAEPVVEAPVSNPEPISSEPVPSESSSSVPVSSEPANQVDPVEPTIAKLSSGLSDAIVSALTEFERARGEEQQKLTAALEQQSQQLSQLSTDLAAVRADLDKIGAEASATKTSAESLTTDLAATRSRISTIDTAIQSVTDTATKTNQEVSRVSDDVAALRESLSSANTRLDNQKAAIRSARQAEQRRLELLQQLNEVAVGVNDDDL